jgi:two-component system cell cycle response regulator DivK
MSRSILVVEDNDMNRQLLTDVLTRCGCTVLSAKNGAEGVSMAITHTPDLILMDIQMPVMNGLEAGKALRNDPRTKDIRLLALTSYNVLEEKDGFFRSGFDGYLDKPLSIKKVREIVKSHLPDEGDR